MSEMPTGTVTFLFTDIEGSTRLAREFPDALPAMLAHHHALMRTACEAHHGHIFQIIGDAFCVAFALPADALAAAVAAQRELLKATADGRQQTADSSQQLAISDQSASINNQKSTIKNQQSAAVSRPPSAVTLRVRMGINTGEAEARAGDYHGYLTLSRTQRVMSAASGGQILVSSQSEAVLRGFLPADVTLRDLGAVQLKDFPQAEHIFQVVVPDLPSEFPALKAGERAPNNLPSQLTSFIGREAEIAEVKRRLATARLLTLTGSGGTGKTRLSLRVAEEYCREGVTERRYPDGVWLVELAPLFDRTLVLQAVATALGLREQAGQTINQTLAEYLHDKQMLVLFDNCEHLLDACAQLAETLLRTAPRLSILASSREALGVPGEQAWRVPSLESLVPNSQVSLSQAQACASVRLFVERAAQANQSFSLTDANAATIAQICYRLDGIPLAIELAAARVKAIRVEQIAVRLDDRFRLLTGGSRTALPRQQTLRSLIDWSYDLLSEAERVLMQRLSVFAGGWTLEAAEAVCASDGMRATVVGAPHTADGAQSTKLPSAVFRLPSEDVLDLLTRLVDKSLVVLDEQAAEPRYRMQETIRQYAHERLHDSGGDAVTGSRHLDWCVALAEEAEPQILGREQAVWLARLDSEHDNIRAALGWALAQGESVRMARIGAAIWRFWLFRGHLSEGRRWLERLFTMGAQRTADWAKTVWAAGLLAFYQADYQTATAYLDSSLNLYRELDNTEGMAYVRLGQAELAYQMGDYQRSIALYDRNLEPLRALTDTHGLALALAGMSLALLATGELDRAASLCEECLSLARRRGDPQGIAGALTSLAMVLLARGDASRAKALAEESLALRRQLGDKGGRAHTHQFLGQVALVQAEYAAAAAHFAQGLALRYELLDKAGIAAALAGLAAAAFERGHAGNAAKLYGAAAALRAAIGAPQTPGQQSEEETRVARLRTHLDESDFNTAWAAGHALTLEQAVALAMAEGQG